MHFPKSVFIASILLIMGSFASAQTAEEIVEKHVAALGGKEAWRKINSLYTEATLDVQGIEIRVVINQLHQKGVRQEMSFMGETGFQIWTPTGGWKFMPFEGMTKPAAMTEQELMETADELDLHGPLVDYKEKGHTLTYIGKESVDGVEAYKLHMKMKNGKEQYIFIDPNTFYALRMVILRKQYGLEEQLASDLSNYQKLPEGIVVPMTLKMGNGTLSITKVEVNQPIDEKIFTLDNE